ncbi:retrovirus-related Pol polyprotein from transposon 297 [Trichonephila clavipes]|nr:retrovirus-related Pol polyprotein from transposon 297 [Trichonephila clavipes]
MASDLTRRCRETLSSLYKKNTFLPEGSTVRLLVKGGNTTIPHTGIMSALDLRSGYFQMAMNPSDIVKTAFVRKNGTYAFRRLPFGLSGAAPNFQKAIDIILKHVIRRFVNVYMDDVIISSPSFT